MDEFSFDSNASGSFDGGLNFDSPVPPSYSEDNTFDSFGSGGQPSADFGSFGEPVVSQGQSMDMGSFGTPTNEQPAQTLDFDSFGTPEPQNTGSFDAQPLGSFDASPIQPNNAQQSPMGSFDAPSPSGLDFDAPAAPQEEQNSLQESFESPAAAPDSPAMGGSFNMSMPSEVSNVMREYEQEHNKFLEEKAQEERTKHQKVVEAAKQDLEKFYNERKQKVSAARDANRNQSSTSSEAPANDKEAWKRLESLINWDSTHTDTSCNTERMRGILVDMKHAA